MVTSMITITIIIVIVTMIDRDYDCDSNCECDCDYDCECYYCIITDPLRDVTLTIVQDHRRFLNHVTVLI